MTETKEGSKWSAYDLRASASSGRVRLSSAAEDEASHKLTLDLVVSLAVNLGNGLVLVFECSDAVEQGECDFELGSVVGCFARVLERGFHLLDAEYQALGLFCERVFFSAGVTSQHMSATRCPRLERGGRLTWRRS